MLKPQQNAHRDLLSLTGFWEVARAYGDGREKRYYEEFPAEGKLGVPGSYNEQKLAYFNHYDEMWYQTTFYTSSCWKDRRVFLHFESVCQNASVWVNGTHVGDHIGPHLPFEFDVTDVLNPEGENKVTVLADSTLDKESLPPAKADAKDLRAGWSNSYPAVAYDFFPFSGIHRPVYLTTCAKQNHIESVRILSSHSGSEAEVMVEVELAEATSGMVQVEVEGVKHSVEVADSATASVSFTIQNPRIWDVGKGELYQLTTRLIKEDATIDSYISRFGIRNVEVKGNQFLLNGKPVIFKGFGKHEDFDVLGKGLSHPLIIKDYDLMEWIGANSFRTTHYPYAEEWLDMADELGVLVISENPFVGLGTRMYKDHILEKALPVVEEHMKRDFNHPSIVMWSLANEPNSNNVLTTPELHDACMKFFTEIITKAKTIDTSRPFTYAMHVNVEDNPMGHLFDVVCINKYYGWYDYTGLVEESLPQFVEKLEGFYEAFQKPILITEFGADAVAGEHHLPEVMFSEEYQSKTIELQYNAIKDKPWFLGVHVWNFADFRVAQSLTRIIHNRKGVFTRSRQPKLAAHMLKRLWNPDS